jgi:hypothetical protein
MAVNQLAVFLFSLLFSFVLSILVKAMQQRKIMYRYGKKEIKLSRFADDMIMYVENPKLIIYLLIYAKKAHWKITIFISFEFING